MGKSLWFGRRMRTCEWFILWFQFTCRGQHLRWQTTHYLQKSDVLPFPSLSLPTLFLSWQCWGKTSLISLLFSRNWPLHWPCHWINFIQLYSHYCHFTQNHILSRSKEDQLEDKPFLDQLEQVLDGSVKCNAIQKCSTLEVYYITLQPHEIPSNEVISALITPSKQVSAGKLASNGPYSMDLCAQFVKSLAKNIDPTSLTHTPNMDMFSCDLTSYLTASAVEKLITQSDPGSSSESKLMHYFKELGKPAIQEFIKHLSRAQHELTFLNFFTYFSHED